MGWKPNQNHSIDTKDIYKESCDVVRLYSVAVRNIRTLGIAHGIVVIGAIGVLYYRFNNMHLPVWVITVLSGYGLAVTVTMWVLHHNYLHNFLAQEELAMNIEKENFGEFRPWTWQRDKRKERWDRWHGLYGALANWAIYVILGVFIFFMGVLPYFGVVGAGGVLF